MAIAAPVKPMFYGSLRWRLQIWHALILSLAIVGFGAVLYLEIRKARLDEIDGEMLAAVRTLDGALRGLPPQVLQSGLKENLDSQRPPRQPERFPPPEGEDEPSRPGPGFGPPASEPSVRFAPREQINRMLTLPASFVDRYTADRSVPFFVAWAGDGSVLKSTGIPKDEIPPRPNFPQSGKDFEGRVRGNVREVFLRGPQRTEILVGRSVEHEMQALRQLLWQIVLTGVAVILLGLAGGRWLSRRAVAPIETMSEMAASISASKLYRRIDLKGIDNELASLGQVLNAMFDRLERSFHQQIQFTADASHELRTPLAVVLTNAELALSRPRTVEEYREMIEVCQRAARRMKVLVDDLLTLARADSGRLELQHANVDLRQLAEECAALIRPLAEQNQLNIHVSGETICVCGDCHRLAQVFTNLLSNAVRYTPPQGHVNVVIQRVGAKAVISVADTGRGIPPADLPHVFDRFARVDMARTREQGGTGLGLAICRSIIEAHGGSIEIGSELNHGTTVTVQLPAAITANIAAERPRLVDLSSAEALGENL